MGLSMDYLRRLLLRTLAVPREQGSAVFDPFAQVAAWELDAHAPTPHESAADTAVGIAPAPPAPHLETTSALPLQPTPAPPSAVTGPSAREAIEPSVAFQMPPASHATEALPASGDKAEAAEPDHVLLAQADAFMRSLGMKSVTAPEEPASRQSLATPSLPAPHRRGTSAPAPRTMETGEPVLVRPAMPPAVERPRVQANPRRMPDAATNTTAAQAPAAPSTPPAAVPPQRIVQTTIVVAGGARALDDLAHSSGISRFGIGQG